MAPAPAPGWVQMTHPEVHVDGEIEPAVVTEAAYNEVWAEKGWEIVDQPDEEVQPKRARKGRKPAASEEDEA